MEIKNAGIYILFILVFILISFLFSFIVWLSEPQNLGEFIMLYIKLFGLIGVFYTSFFLITYFIERENEWGF